MERLSGSKKLQLLEQQ